MFTGDLGLQKVELECDAFQVVQPLIEKGGNGLVQIWSIDERC